MECDGSAWILIFSALMGLLLIAVSVLIWLVIDIETRAPESPAWGAVFACLWFGLEALALTSAFWDERPLKPERKGGPGDAKSQDI